jgi:hypothetical protein
MHHLNENTYLLMTNVIKELISIINAKQADPGPMTHEEFVTLRKAEEVRNVALSEARLAGILPHGGKPDAPVA